MIPVVDRWFQGACSCHASFAYGTARLHSQVINLLRPNMKQLQLYGQMSGPRKEAHT